ncbi:hypothetical protein T484DRAFT_1836903 [Baffinella frigidus]|nr:hypothetical protein T484DRAFT_1836903 [Cryptophyta sp. CCMP2293]
MPPTHQGEQSVKPSEPPPPAAPVGETRDETRDSLADTDAPNPRALSREKRLRTPSVSPTLPAAAAAGGVEPQGYAPAAVGSAIAQNVLSPQKRRKLEAKNVLSPQKRRTP